MMLASAPLLYGAGEDDALRLWYDRPAKVWEEALAVGNGRLGAMVFGDPVTERLQINEDTVWAGGPYHPVNPEARKALPEVRRLVNQGRYTDAEKLINEKVMALPRGQMAYQTVGSLLLKFPSAEMKDFRRELDLDTAIATVSYTAGEVKHRREVFSSAPDDVIVVRLTADKPGSIVFTAGMESPMSAVSVSTVGDDTLVLKGEGADWNGIEGVIDFESRVKIVAKGGKVSSSGQEIAVEGADSVLLLIAAATNFVKFDDVSGDPEARVTETLSAVVGKSFESLQATHLEDYQPMFRRVTLDLGKTEAARLPTDERIKQFAQGNDPQLPALYYQFGRYLLLSSSRPGTQPANLQGIWNQSTNPPWQSKYTLNINAEMNYWPAESGNLAECIEPLIRMIEELTITGGRMAEDMYGARGWVVHHNTDLWRATAPIDAANWGMWPTGGAWLCLHLWDRFLFSGDVEVLKRIYPVMKGSCEFFLDTLQEDPSGKWLVTNPSNSPELMHPKGTTICAGPAMDMQLLRDLFAHTRQAAEWLKVDESFRRELSEARRRLAPDQIGKAGQLQEWMEDWDLEIGDKHHRHVSHLYGVFPGRDISLREAPELAQAARKSLEMRGDKATGWATAWRLCLWTHLGDGDRAYSILRHLITPELTYPNMFDSHPPFQIDGNFGGAAGIVEMIMQSRLGELDLLPALPKDLADGKATGLRARGGLEVDIEWRDHQLVSARLRLVGNGPREVLVRLRDRETKVSFVSDRAVKLGRALEVSRDTE